MQKYKCKVCGYEYDPKEGDIEARIVPDTPFGTLPDTWECPVCGEKANSFYPIEEEK